jgi:hypothetical protein
LYGCGVEVIVFLTSFSEEFVFCLRLLINFAFAVLDSERRRLACMPSMSDLMWTRASYPYEFRAIRIWLFETFFNSADL